jgi:hypothetical protein
LLIFDVREFDVREKWSGQIFHICNSGAGKFLASGCEVAISGGSDLSRDWICNGSLLQNHLYDIFDISQKNHAEETG